MGAISVHYSHQAGLIFYTLLTADILQSHQFLGPYHHVLVQGGPINGRRIDMLSTPLGSSDASGVLCVFDVASTRVPCNFHANASSRQQQQQQVQYYEYEGHVLSTIPC